MPQNKKNHDGSVNSYQETGNPGSGYTVSFGNSNFKDEIEENIFEAVILLNSKGYETVTSCHGHSRFAYYFCNAITWNLGPVVTIKHTENINFPSTFFVTTSVNGTIPLTETHRYTEVHIRSWLEVFFTNKFLCSILTRYCERLPSVYDIN